MFLLAGIVLLIAGAVVGVGRNDGLMKKGSDTTYRDTVEAEKYATLESLEHIEKLEEKHPELLQEPAPVPGAVNKTLKTS